MGKRGERTEAGGYCHLRAEVKHWHGAAPDSFQHLAIEVPGENCRNEWCEPVPDAEYGQLK